LVFNRFQCAHTANGAKGVAHVGANKNVVVVNAGEGLDAAQHDFCTCRGAHPELIWGYHVTNVILELVEKYACCEFEGSLKQGDWANAAIWFGEWRNPSMYEDGGDGG